MTDRKDELVIVGRISGLYGVQGWVKVFSYTQPRKNILQYVPWYLGVVHAGTDNTDAQGDDRLRDSPSDGVRWQPLQLESGRVHGKGIIARLAGISDRDAAAALLGRDIAVLRACLPVLQPDEFYWSDLVGLQVVGIDGSRLGVVDHLIETGANDVLVVRDEGEGGRERLIPYLRDEVIKHIDLQAGVIRVDWDADF